MGKDRSNDNPASISFRVDPETLGAEIAKRAKVGGSPHVQAREGLQRYFAILRQEMPSLTRSEWMVVYAVMNGVWTDEHTLRLVYANLEDAPRHHFEEFDVDREAIVTKAKEWSVAEAAAVVDRAERYWTRVHNEEDTEDLESSTYPAGDRNGHH